MRSEFTFHVNLYLALIMGLLIILIDFYRKRNADPVARRLLACMIIFTLGTMTSDLIYDVAEGRVGDFARAVILLSNAAYFIFQIFAFGYMALFLDHCMRGDAARLKKLTLVVDILCLLNILIVYFGVASGYVFQATLGGYYVRADGYFLVPLSSYLIILLIFIDALQSRKHINMELFVLVLVSVLPAAIGAIVDINVPGLRIVRACFFASLLFAYLFVLSKIALIDSLTGIDNRRSFDEYLAYLMKANRRRAYSFIMIDLDRFKEINDTYGHAEGDRALKDMAAILRGTLRRSDFLARIGGDEFAAIVAAQEPQDVIWRIDKAVAVFNSKRQRPYQLELSCGGARFTPDDKRTPQEFLAHVDTLMYTVKEEHHKRQAYARR